MVEKVQSLKAQLSDTQTELASLQQQYSLSEKRLVRASKLISALGDEAGRWSMSADTLATSLQLLIGQSLTRGLHVPLCVCVISSNRNGLKIGCKLYVKGPEAKPTFKLYVKGQQPRLCLYQHSTSTIV